MKNNQFVVVKGIFGFVIICTLGIFFGSCKKESTTPPDPNEEELITSLRISLTDSAGVKPNLVVNFKDADGDGGNAPSAWDTIKLATNTTYYASLLLLDETKTPADIISDEVKAEGIDHLFCFTTSSINCVINRTDFDLNGLELGLSSTWRTSGSSAGAVQVVLRHQPSIKNGSCTPGESDIDVTFQCLIQ